MLSEAPLSRGVPPPIQSGVLVAPEVIRIVMCLHLKSPLFPHPDPLNLSTSLHFHYAVLGHVVSALPYAVLGHVSAVPFPAEYSVASIDPKPQTPPQGPHSQMQQACPPPPVFALAVPPPTAFFSLIIVFLALSCFSSLSPNVSCSQRSSPTVLAKGRAALCVFFTSTHCSPSCSNWARHLLVPSRGAWALGWQMPGSLAVHRIPWAWNSTWA